MVSHFVIPKDLYDGKKGIPVLNSLLSLKQIGMRACPFKYDPLSLDFVNKQPV